MAEGRRGRAGPVRPVRGGHPARRGSQPVASEYRLAWDGGRSRGPLLQAGHRWCPDVNLDAAVLEDLGQPLQLPGPRLDQLLAVAGQLPDRRDLRGWDEAAPQQTA